MSYHLPRTGRRAVSYLRAKGLPLIGVVAVLTVAASLRLYGLGWDDGLPYTPHPDERAILMEVAELSPPSLGNLGALLDPDESTWNPRWFNYGSFPLYLLKGAELAYELASGGKPFDLRLAGRAISALADVGTVAIVFLLGSRMYDRRTGLLASALVALAVIHVQLSHFLTVDTLLTLLVAAALYFMYRVASRGRTADSMIAGALLGLALATKVSVAPLLAAFVIAHLMLLFAGPSGRKGPPADFSDLVRVALSGLLAGVAALLVATFVAQPYAFLDAYRFLGDVSEQSEMARRIRDFPYTRQYVDTTPYLYHLRQLAAWGLGWPLGIVAWAGLAYASVRGMRLRYGAAYLVLGVGAPIALLSVSTSLLAVCFAVGVSLLALAATLPMRPQDSRSDVLLLSWVVPSLLITGALEVKFLRYLLPMTPFLVLFGARMLVSLADAAQRSRSGVGRLLKPWPIAVIALVLGASGFYALSYISIYNRPHTAAGASQWIVRNVPEGSVILKEHWDEGLPGLGGYSYNAPELELTVYDPDSPEKLRRIAGQLSRADYMVLFSNRLYGTIPRLPHRYPATSAYYRLLFSGALGYDLAHVESAQPELLGVGFVEDTFGRPGVPEPAALDRYPQPPLALNLGFADESFSVYDHPKVLIFQNVGRLDADTIAAAIDRETARVAPALPEGAPGELGLMLTPEEAAAHRRGGSWSEIVRPGSWAERLPVAAWLIVLEGIALLAFPVAFMVFRPLPDRGYLFSKVLGLLLVGVVVWLLASAARVAVSPGSISAGMIALAGVSTAILAVHGREIVSFVMRRWRLLLIGEALFLAAFFIFLVVRMANPDLWHEWRGGEKPMDFAYLNAVLRSSFMPPYDPWFGGGHMNYYYWGHFLVAMLIRATGIVPDIAFNLAVPSFFALTAAMAFGIVYNLAEATRRRLHPTEGGRLAWSPVLAGGGAALFVTVLGNLDGAIQVGQGAWRVMFQDGAFGEFDFWRSSRMMPSQQEGITEFPFFTYLFADLHAHLMALPVTLFVLAAALAVLMSGAGRSTPRAGTRLAEAARLAVLGLAVGALVPLNAWDFPTYLLVGAAAVFLAEYYAHGGLGLGVILRGLLKSALAAAVGYLAFLPYHASNETFFTSIWATTHTTVLWRFLAINGLFIFVVGSFFLNEIRDLIGAALGRALRLSGRLVRGVSDRGDEEASGVSLGWAMLVPLGALLAGLGVTAVLSGVVGSTAPFLFLFLAVVLAAAARWLPGTRPDGPCLIFAAMMAATALGLALGLEFFRVAEDIDRMNSIFKFYLQVWVLLALASAYLLWRMWYDRPAVRTGAPLRRAAWLCVLVLLLLSAAVYPVLGTRARVGDRFQGRTLPLTLDGTAYAESAVYRDREGEIDLGLDFHGIRWLRENVVGSPVVLEGVTPTYRWGSRVSVYTGLPTVIGWQWHQEQQRWAYRWAVGDRILDVERVYTTIDGDEALSLLRKYGVEYVYIGRLERLYYPGPGLDKFDGAMAGDLEKVYRNPEVSIYRVR